MKKKYSILICSFFVILISNKVGAQGCVAIKGTAGICSRPSDAKGWELNLNNRYFRSYSIM